MRFVDIPNSPRQHILVYGNPGTGKTQLVSKLAEEGFDLYWFSLDNGHAPIFQKLSPEAQARIDVCVLPDTDSYPISAVVLPQLMTGQETKLCFKHGHPKCSRCKPGEDHFDTYNFNELTNRDAVVVIDHLSIFADSLWTKISGSLTSLSETLQFEAAGDKMALQQYGLLGKHLNRFFSLVKQAPFHIVCIAQVTKGKDEIENERTVPYVGSRNYSTSVSAFFDHVIYSEVIAKSHKFYSGSTSFNNVIAKSRSDIEIERMVEPKLSPFFGRQVEYKTAEDKKLNQSSSSSVSSSDRLKAMLAGKK